MCGHAAAWRSRSRRRDGFHIVENHDGLAGHYDDVVETVENPEVILQGDEGALVAKRAATAKTLDEISAAVPHLIRLPQTQRGRVIETIRNPAEVLEGDFGAKLAARFYRHTPLTSKHLVVAHREVSPTDGFVMTAYFARRLPAWRRRLWKQ